MSNFLPPPYEEALKWLLRKTLGEFNARDFEAFETV